MDADSNERISNAANSFTSQSIFPEAETTWESYNNNAKRLKTAAKIVRGLSTADLFTNSQMSFSKLPSAKKPSSVWETCCTEVAQEIVELNKLLETLQLPPSSYSKEKSFPWVEYDEELDMETCQTKPYLDSFVLPFLLPGILSLLEFAKNQQVFQCRYITFNSIDYLCEYLYNNNPLHPERLESPKAIDEIVFIEKWEQNFPRSPLPNWLTMPEDTAAIKIQRAVRGFLARRRPDVMQMRQYWKEYKQEMYEQLNRKSSMIFPLTVEAEEDDEDEVEPELLEILEAHSQSCGICSRFREFFDQMDAAEEQRQQIEIERTEVLDNSSEEEETESFMSLHENEHHSEHHTELLAHSHESIHSNASEEMEHSPQHRSMEEINHRLSSNLSVNHDKHDIRKSIFDHKEEPTENGEYEHSKHLSQ